jgi:predicted PurR-regulated permease PerM
MKPQLLTGTLLALIIGGLALLVLVIVKLAPLVLLILIAIVLTAGIDPLVQRVQRFMPRALATLLVMAAGLLVLVGAVAFLLTTAIREAISFAQHGWPVLQPKLMGWLASLADRYPALPKPDALLDQLEGQSGQIGGYLVNTTRTVFGFVGGLFSLVIVVILTLFFTMAKDGIVYTLTQFVPKPYQARFHEIGHKAAEKMGGWLRGQLILAFLITIITLPAMLLLRVDYAMLIAIIGGIGELIPMVGPYLAFIPAIAIVLLSPDPPLWQIIGVVVFFTILSQVENYVLSPRVMERHVELAPVTSILALLVGGGLLGLVGAVLAVPMAAAGRVILLEAVFPAIQNIPAAQIEAKSPGAPQPKPTKKSRSKAKA